VPPPLQAAHPPLLDPVSSAALACTERAKAHASAALEPDVGVESGVHAQDANGAPTSPRLSPRQFKRVFGSMQPNSR